MSRVSVTVLVQYRWGPRSRVTVTLCTVSVSRPYEPRYVLVGYPCESKWPSSGILASVFGGLNKATPSYTAQYASTTAGTLLPQVFLCMQKTKRDFAARVCKTVQVLINKHKNVFIIASKSGKLTKHHFADFAENITSPYCKNHKFLWIFDSWGGQIDIGYFNNVFTDEEENYTSTFEIISTLHLILPCNANFFRQIKNFIKKSQNAIEILQNTVNFHEDVIKIHSLIHFLLFAPVFNAMVKYSW